MDKKNKKKLLSILIVVLLIAAVIIGSMIFLKMREYDAGAEFYNGLRSEGVVP